MIILVVLVSFAIALLRGGRPRSDVAIRYLWAAPAAFTLQLVSRLVPGTWLGSALIILSYVLLIAVLVCNARYQSLRLLLLGVLLNALVIAANGGRIPVDTERAERIGLATHDLVAGQDAKHVAMSDATVLSFLGDVIPVRYPIPKMISIGDICVMIGIFLFIQEFMGRRMVIATAEGEPASQV